MQISFESQATNLLHSKCFSQTRRGTQPLVYYSTRWISQKGILFVHFTNTLTLNENNRVQPAHILFIKEAWRTHVGPTSVVTHFMPVKWRIWQESGNILSCANHECPLRLTKWLLKKSNYGLKGFQLLFWCETVWKYKNKGYVANDDTSSSFKKFPKLTLTSENK